MKIPKNLKWLSTGETLGEGGQGQVCLVTNKHEPSGKKYAMKKLKKVNCQKARSRFYREVEAIREIEHRAIVRIIDHSLTDDDFQFYVMEYFEGARTLSKIIHSQTNPYHGDVRLCLALFEEIVSAIQACERLSTPIIHRDISPNNVLVLTDGSIRLIDFGICQIEGGETISLTGEGFGTRNYAAPECESGSNSNIDHRTDVYSAAKVLWSAITSKEAFAREAPVFQSHSMRNLHPIKPETWPLALIFEKSIRKSPEDRFSGTNEALDLVQELNRFFQRGHSSVQDIIYRCPACGWKNYREVSREDRMLRPIHIRYTDHFTCSMCGLEYDRNVVSIQRQDERRRQLD